MSKQQPHGGAIYDEQTHQWIDVQKPPAPAEDGAPAKPGADDPATDPSASIKEK